MPAKQSGLSTMQIPWHNHFLFGHMLAVLRLQALQLALKEVSVYYKDKTATIGPRDFSGIMEFTLPEQGVDVDFKFRLIPNTPQGLGERQKRGRFFIIERVEVTLI